MANNTTKSTIKTRPTVGQISKHFADLATAESDASLYFYDNGIEGGLITAEKLALSTGKTVSIETIEDAMPHLVSAALAGILGTTGDIEVELNDSKTAVDVSITGLSEATVELFDTNSITFSISTDLNDKYEVYQIAKKGEEKMVMNDETGVEELKTVRKVNGIVKQIYAEIMSYLTKETYIMRRVKGQADDTPTESIIKEEVIVNRKLRLSKSTNVWFTGTQILPNATSCSKAFGPIGTWAPLTMEDKEVKDKETLEISIIQVEVGGFKQSNLVNGILVPKAQAGFDTTEVSDISTKDATTNLTVATLEVTKKNTSVSVEELVEAVGEEQSVKFAAYKHLVDIVVEDNITVTFPRAFFRNGTPKRYETLYLELDTDIVTITMELPNSEAYEGKGNNISRFIKSFKEQFKALKADYKIAEEAGNGAKLIKEPKSEETKAIEKAERAAKRAEKDAKKAAKDLEKAKAVSADTTDEFDL